MDDPLECSATELSRRIRQHEISCRELMQHTLERVRLLNPRFNALVSLQDGDDLLQQADQRDAQLGRGERCGWMHGFPLAVKDLSAVRGLPTTRGSPLFKNNVPDFDALFVQRMKQAGAIVIGKTNTPEFGLGSHTYNTVFGTTLNAYDDTCTAGGSSGGAAVALALRMLPVADGSDMGGSLRNPAAFNNVYGLRPSFGRVPSVPALDSFFQQLGTEGPMARSPEDLARLLAIQSGRDARAPLSLYGEGADADALTLDVPVRGLRIGWLGSIWPDLPVAPGILGMCESGLHLLEGLGCRVAPAVLDFARERSWSAWTTLRQFSIGGMLAGDHADPVRRAQFKPEAVWEVEGYLRLSAADVHRATVDRSALYQAVLALFDQHDVLVAPTAQVFPFEAHRHWPECIGDVQMDSYHRWMEVITPMTLTGLPTVSVPLGFNADGLPMGMQLIGRPGADHALLGLAQQYHLASQWPQKRRPPALAALHGA